MIVGTPKRHSTKDGGECLESTTGVPGVVTAVAPACVADIVGQISVEPLLYDPDRNLERLLSGGYFDRFKT